MGCQRTRRPASSHPPHRGLVPVRVPSTWQPLLLVRVDENPDELLAPQDLSSPRVELGADRPDWHPRETRPHPLRRVERKLPALCGTRMLSPSGSYTTEIVRLQPRRVALSTTGHSTRALSSWAARRRARYQRVEGARWPQRAARVGDQRGARTNRIGPGRPSANQDCGIEWLVLTQRCWA